MGIVYSHSRLDTYFQCPLRYKFRYVDRIKTDTQGIEAFMGSRVHSVLEKLYQDKSLQKENSIEYLLEFYESDWQKNWHDKVQIVKKDYTAQNYKATGAQAIKDYYKRYHPFDDGKTVGLEKCINIDLNGDKKYRLLGYIDRLVLKEGNCYEIHDYKTSNELPTQEKFDNDRQLALYQIGIEQMWPDAKEIDLVWHYLKHDKEIRSHRKPEELKILKAELTDRIDQVEKSVAAKNFEPCESALCNWCDYQDLCPKRKHLYKVGTLPPNEYLNEDGVTLVNKYVELREEKKAFVSEKETEIAKIEEALIQLAQKEGYEAIAGSNHQVKIDLSPRLCFPTKTKTPDELIALEQLVRDTGIWDDMSKLDTNKLSSALKNGDLTEEQIQNIKELLILDDKPKLRVSKIK